MNGRPFLDTNIVVYAFSSNDPRTEQAEALLAAGGVISVQVLSEFVNVSRRKLGRGWAEIDEALGVLKVLLDPPEPLTMELHEAAVDVARRHGFSIYDSLIVAAASRAGCAILYSEDLQHGQRIGQLTVQNPFIG
ncbi:MAG TPA: PIN domain-containing protein [Vineibacter sp.]|nr:PIN domain-containing protein [Vineibacter sp.]